MKKPIFTGASVAIVTPFTETGAVDFEQLKKLIDYQIAHKTDSITLAGTTGEASALHDEEHRELIAFGVKYINHRVPVICGAGSNHTDYAIELTKFSAEVGADAVLSVTPYYNKTTQAGLVRHFTDIADCADIPVILYNVPSRTGMCFTPETYRTLSKHPRINGVKEASGNFTLIAESMNLCGDEMNFWSGNDDQVVALAALGGKGVISVLSNIAPEVSHEIAAACLAGDFKKGAALQLQYMPLINALFTETNPIPVKAAMEHLGWNMGGLRLPLVPLGDTHRALLEKEMDAAGCKR